MHTDLQTYATYKLLLSDIRNMVAAKYFTSAFKLSKISKQSNVRVPPIQSKVSYQIVHQKKSSTNRLAGEDDSYRKIVLQVQRVSIATWSGHGSKPAGEKAQKNLYIIDSKELSWRAPYRLNCLKKANPK